MIRGMQAADLNSNRLGRAACTVRSHCSYARLDTIDYLDWIRLSADAIAPITY